MNCRTCQHYLPSKDAGQRAYMDGYGYCKAGTREQRCMFFQCDRPCWLEPVKYQERRP